MALSNTSLEVLVAETIEEASSALYGSAKSASAEEALMLSEMLVFNSSNAASAAYTTFMEETTEGTEAYERLADQAALLQLLQMSEAGVELTAELYAEVRESVDVDSFRQTVAVATAYETGSSLYGDVTGETLAVRTAKGEYYFTSDPKDIEFMTLASQEGADIVRFEQDNLGDSLESSILAASLTGGQSKVGYTSNPDITNKLLSTFNEQAEFLSSNSSNIVTLYQEGPATPAEYTERIFEQYAEAHMPGGAIPVSTEEIIKAGQFIGRALAPIIISGDIKTFVEGTVLLAASEGYIAAETAYVINDIYTTAKTIEDVSILLEDIKTGDITGIIESELFEIDDIGIDEGIVDTVVAINDISTDIQAFQSGGLQEQLAISGKYLPSLEGGYLQELADAGEYDTLAYLNDLSLSLDLGDLDFLAIDGFNIDEFNLSSLELQDMQSNSLELDYSSLDIDLSGLDINFEGLQLPESSTQSSEEETVVAQEETTTQEDTSSLEGEVDISLPEQAQLGRGKPIKEEDEGFEQTNIFQAKTEGTTEIGLETPTVGIDPLALDIPSFVNPYDPTKKYDPLRSV